MKKKTKIRLAVIAALIIVVVGGYTALGALATPPLARVSFTVLEPGSLSDTISIRGAVESTNRRNVNSTLNFLVDEVFVEVGDVVREGDILAVLDTADLDLNIRQQRAELDSFSESNLLGLESSERMYREARSNLAAGQNPQVLSAENAYRTAAANLETAQRNYDEALDDFNNPNNAQLQQARTAFNLAELDLENAQRTFERNQVLFEAGAVSRNILDNAETALTTAQNRYNDASAALDNISITMRRTLDNAQTQLDNAQMSYNNAAGSLSSATTTANQEISRLASNVDSSQIAVNNDARLIAIERLERQMEDSVIRAPISGTVTAVFAREGAMGSGLLFVIEDTENLKITTRIREYDAVSVHVGMEVEIRTDSTGQEIFNGVISSIAPTAMRNAQGDIANISDVEFAAEVDVVSVDTPLLIGMNTRLNVLLDQRDNVFFVPFDAVDFDMFGDAYIFVADVNDNAAVARRMPVQVGLETDFFAEIISPDLFEGLIVLNNAANVTDGMEVAIN